MNYHSFKQFETVEENLLPMSRNQAFNTVHCRKPTQFVGNSNSLHSLISPIIDNCSIIFIICKYQCIVILRKVQWQQRGRTTFIGNIYVIIDSEVIHLRLCCCHIYKYHGKYENHIIEINQPNMLSVNN